MKAVLITIGDEILSGTTVDTNSNFIANQLKEIGIPVVQIYTVADDLQTIKNTLSAAAEISDLIITTGGIGPTKDDKTKLAYAEFFQDELVLDEDVYEHLRRRYIKMDRANLIEINRDQAVVLSKAKIFQNENGSAPCQMISENGKITICLPGVPFEVKPLIKDKIIPYLKNKFSLQHIISRIISVVDYPESLLAVKIEDWELALSKNIALSYLPIGNRVKLRLTATGKDKRDLEHQLVLESEKLRPLIGEKVISWNGSDIQEILKEILIQKKLTVSTAESCTGGELSRLITSVSGSSAYFIGGIIPYNVQQKIETLGVSEYTISIKTTVSPEVAQEMSLGCRKLFNTDISLSTTGVSGPNTDEFENPVGLAFYSIRVKNFEKTNRLFLPHLERNDFANFVSQRVLQDLVEVLVREIE